MSGFPTEEPPPPARPWARARVLPGTGLVARRGDTLLVVPVLRPAHHANVRDLVELCDRPEPAGRTRVDEVRALLDRHPGAEVPGFVLLVRSGRSVRAVVHGPVQLLVDGRPASRASDDRDPAEHVLDDGAWTGMTVAAEGDPAAAGGGPPDDVLPLDLESGTVPGGGVALQRIPDARGGSSAPATPASTPVSAPVPVSAPTSATALRPVVQFRTVLLGECAERAGGLGGGARDRRRAPLPVADEPADGMPAAAEPDVLVEGVRCPAGHFTDPAQSTCRTCSTPLPADGRREQRPRPPLGVVVTDGGTVYPVTGDLVIGREPEQAPDVLAGQARPLPLRDSARSTSRVHAHLTVEGWRVLLRDDSSANGTFVSRHGAAGPWLPVTPRAPLALEHGDRVRLGKRQLLFDAWRDTVVPGGSG